MIFVDSSAWVGIALENDQYHPRATRVYEELLSSEIRLVTTDYVLSETYTFLRYRVSDFQDVRKFHDIITESEKERLLTVRWTTQSMFQDARRLFLKYSDQKFSMIDCISFLTAKELKLKEVFTFDRDFLTMGFQVIPSS